MARPGGVGGPLESASEYVRGKTSAVPTHDEPSGQRDVRAAAEEKRLRQWAFDQYDNPQGYKLPAVKLGRGAEHEIYDKGKRVVKVTRKSEPAGYGFGISLNNDGRGATAAEYLDRLRLHNDIFNDDVRIEGVLPMVGATKIIISQPHIRGEPAEPVQIDAYMAAKGFARLAPGTYYHIDTGILVHDLHPRNVVVTPQGKVRVIDPAIMRATPELAEHVRQMAGRASSGQK